MENKQKWHQKSWFEPTIIIIGIILIILAVELAVHRPFAGLFKALRSKQEVKTYDMARIVTDSDPFLGDRGAPIKIVEFGDFDCPYCRAAYPIIREALSGYEADQVFFQFRDFPVVSTSSVWLAMAGACAHEQEKFWPMHDKLYQRQGQVSEANIGSLAQSVGLDLAKFQNCLSSEKYKNEVAEDFLTAEEYDVSGTPTFFINGMVFQGVPEKENFKKIIDQLISMENSKIQAPNSK